jgi:simple sugar transport system ATP-binding protein
MKVDLKHICKSFGLVQANDDVSLVVQAGTIHGLLGENGAGKSTLVKVLSGFISRDRGQILLNGHAVEIRTPADAIQFGVGMLHQDPLDFPPLSVLDNFMAGKPGRFLANFRQTAQEFAQLAHQFNFSLDIHAKVSDLTVGERQQLEILRLLSLGAQTLILDEPTTGISPSQKMALFTAIKQWVTEGKSVIFVSHKFEDVEELCDEVTVLRQGKVMGNLPIPAPDSQLIQLMFGRELAQPKKLPMRQEIAALQLKDIQLESDRLPLKIDHLTVHKGEIIGLAGLEGSGQQQLLRLCAGLLKPSRGQIKLEGIEITHRPYQDYLKAGVGYFPADRLKDGLVRGLTIHEHVALRTPSRSRFVNWRATLEQTQQAIALFNIRGKTTSRVERLSGGNQQRTQLALLPVPLNLLLMEHPTRGLDIESTLWVWSQLVARCQGGTSILFMSSDLDEIMQYSDRIIVFSGGKTSPPMAVSELTLEKLGQLIGGRFPQPEQQISPIS